MSTARRPRPAADIAVGYAADAQGHGIAYVAIATGTTRGTVRVPFTATPLPALEGREIGYAAVAAVGSQLKRRGFGHVRIRLADEAVVADLSGAGTPPKALAMAYVTTRCLLRGMGAVRLETADPIETRDLTSRALAEVTLHVAA